MQMLCALGSVIRECRGIGEPLVGCSRQLRVIEIVFRHACCQSNLVKIEEIDPKYQQPSQIVS